MLSGLRRVPGGFRVPRAENPAAGGLGGELECQWPGHHGPWNVCGCVSTAHGSRGTTQGSRGTRGTAHGTRGTTQGSRDTTQGRSGTTQGSRGTAQGSRGTAHHSPRKALGATHSTFIQVRVRVTELGSFYTHHWSRFGRGGLQMFNPVDRPRMDASLVASHALLYRTILIGGG